MKFKYNDKVIVTDGFYKGLSGVVCDHVSYCGLSDNYYVKITLVDNDTREGWISEKYLVKINVI